MRNNRIFFRIFLVLLAISGFGPLLAGGGGPDVYGYTWKDSNEPGVAFDWVDIVNKPGAMQITGLGDDGITSLLPLGFPFQYYWRVEDQVRIGANGWLSFEPGPSSNSWCFQTLPQAVPGTTNSTLAPFLSDLSFATSFPSFPNVGELWLWSNQQDSFVVSYIDVPWWRFDSAGTSPPDWGGANTFQVILSGQDSTITYQYKSMDDSAFVDRPQCSSEIVIGIENLTGSIGLQAYVETVVPDSYAIRFYPPTLDTFPVRDAAVAWSMQEESKGQFVIVDSAFEVTARISNEGNVQIDTPVVVEARLRTQSLATLWLSRDTLDSIPVGVPQLVTYTDMPRLPTIAQYNLSIEVTQPGDAFLPNNIRLAELDAVPDTGLYFPLRYTYNTATSTSLSWPAGGDGAGFYMTYPFGPIRILSAEVYIVGNDADTLTPLPAGFRVDIHADSMGQPGAPLATELVPSWAARDEWNFIPFANQVRIDSGGFYVSWIQGGAGIGLGTETSGPVSRQTFEIINGDWAPYRFTENEDFMIKLNVERLLEQSRPRTVEALAYMKLFPNPSNGNVRVQYQLRKPQAVQLRVSDMIGRIVLQHDIAENAVGMRNLSLELEDVSPGMYHVTLSGKGGTVSQKLMIAR